MPRHHNDPLFTMSDQYMKETIRLAGEKMNAGEGGPFGALIVKGGEIISRGWNRVTSANDPTAHAEIVAIRNACQSLETFSLEGCSLYVNCEPCPMCLAAAYWARVDDIFFAATREDAARIGFDDDLIYRETCLPFTERQLPMRQIMRDESLVAFRLWEEKKDKILY